MSYFQLLAPLLLTVSISGLVPVPKKQVGFVYKSGSSQAPIHLDFYIDQLCPYSKAAWPTVLDVAEHYGPGQLRLTTHLFPLPYHRNSYYATKGSHIVNQLTSGRKTYDWITTVFNQRSSLLGGVTQDVPDNQIVTMYADIANTSLSLSPSNFTSLFHDSDTIEGETRIGWKYCCSRGVSGTPTFMINDVIVDASSDWKMQDWTKIIEPLL